MQFTEGFLEVLDYIANSLEHTQSRVSWFLEMMFVYLLKYEVSPLQVKNKATFNNCLTLSMSYTKVIL